MAFAVETTRGGATVGSDGKVVLERSFRLDTGNAASRPAWGIALIGINRFDVHPDDFSCRATAVNCQPIDGELGWFDVTYTYESRVLEAGTTADPSGDPAPGASDPQEQPNPTLRPPTVAWGSNTRNVPFVKDFAAPNRHSVVNSAGQRFEGQEIEERSGTIHVTFNRADVDVQAKQETFVMKVNDGAFSVLPIYSSYPTATLRCNSFDATLKQEDPYGWYYECNAEFEYKRGGWYRDILDEGFYELIPPVGSSPYYEQRRIINPQNGMNIDAPVKLNGHGRKLAPYANPVVSLPYFVEDAGGLNVAVYIKFTEYELQSFTNIFA